MNCTKKLVFASLVSVLSLTLLWQPVLARDAINTNGSDKNIAISGLDTVAFFTQHKAVAGSEKFTHEWKGAKWLFASEEDRALFAANPEKYAPQWGGYCAVGVANGHVSKHLVKGSYDIEDGKLYLFAEGKPNDFDYWRKDWLEKNGGPRAKISKGEANWKLLKPRVEAGENAPALPGTPFAKAAKTAD